MIDNYRKHRVVLFGFSYGVAIISSILFILNKFRQFQNFLIVPMTGIYPVFWFIIYGIFYAIAGLLWYKKVIKFGKVSFRYCFFLWVFLSIVALMLILSLGGPWGLILFLNLAIPIAIIGGVYGIIANFLLRSRYYTYFSILFILIFIILTNIGYSISTYEFGLVSEEFLKNLGNRGEVEKLVKYLGNINADVRECAEDELIKIDSGSGKTISILKRYICKLQGNRDLRLGALYLLNRIYLIAYKKEERKKEYMDLYNKVQDPEVKWQILEVFQDSFGADYKNREVVPLMIDLLSIEEDIYVKEKIINVLECRAGPGAGYPPIGVSPAPEKVKEISKWWLKWWEENKRYYSK